MRANRLPDHVFSPYYARADAMVGAWACGNPRFCFGESLILVYLYWIGHQGVGGSWTFLRRSRVWPARSFFP